MKKSIVKILALALVAVMACVVFVSCDAPNSNPDKAVEALKDNGYNATKIDGVAAAISMAWAGDVDTVVTGAKGLEEGIFILYYEDKEAANKAWDKVEDYYEDAKEDDDEHEYVINKSGKMIYFGTKQAVKDAK